MTATAAPLVRTRMIMGLPFSLHVRPDAKATAAEIDAAATRAWAVLEDADRRFSTYKPDSEISRLASGRLRPEAAGANVHEVLVLAERARLITRGWFDIAGGGRLDPSGIVKGWAAQRAAQAIRLESAPYYLNAGGDLTLRVPGHGEPWRIGIEHPDDPTGLLTVLSLSRGAVATSGRAHRGDHLWDPTTGLRARDLLQATVIGPSLLWADVLATAAAVAGPDRLDRRGWPPGYQVLYAGADGTVTATPGVVELVAPDVPELQVARWI